MRTLTPEQDRAVHAAGPVCLVASAGSGKTAVLVERYLSLLERGLRPDQILTVTFTRKAGQQLRDRILERLAESPESVRDSVKRTPLIGTLHSFCRQILQQWGGLLGREAMGDIVDPLVQAELVTLIRDRWMAALPDSQLEALFEWWTPQDLNSMAKEVLQRPHSFRAALVLSPSEELPDLIRAAFTPLLALWEKELHSRRLCTFDDLEHDAVRLLRDFEAPRAYFQKHLGAVLVDEFQDTSPSQWTLIQGLVGEDERKLFVVGDPKQSIYRFRHADVRLFQQWGERIKQRGGDLLELRTCFRSSPELVDQVNRVSGILFQGSALAEATMVSGRTAGELPPLEVHRYPGETSAHATLEEQALTARAVQALVRAGTAPSEIALLFRNSDRMEAFANALSGLGVPVACEPVAPLFSLYEVQDLTAYLRAVAEPLEDYLLAAFLRTPYAGFGPAQLQELTTARGATLFEKLLLSGKLPWFASLVERGECGTAAVLTELFSQTTHWPWRSGAVHRLLGGLATSTLLPEALARLNAWSYEGVSVTSALSAHQDDGVRLMTVHGSKGLEFSEVFLVDALRRPPTRLPWFHWEMDSGLGVRFRDGGEIRATAAYESILETHRREETQEAGRILYVALTRAKDRLHWMLPENAKLIPKGSWGDQLVP
jgi:ATP-dependent exoDNAse (exonuclease V) beta subunit